MTKELELKTRLADMARDMDILAKQKNWLELHWNMGKLHGMTLAYINMEQWGLVEIAEDARELFFREIIARKYPVFNPEVW